MTIFYVDVYRIEAREERQLGSLRRQRINLRLADALIVTDSRLVIRVENMVTTCTSSLHVYIVNYRHSCFLLISRLGYHK